MPTRLLVVDDDPIGLLVLSEALRGRLRETVIDVALSTTSALALLRDHDYHAVLSDVRMAGMDGLALLNQVRERWPNTPVIMVTGGGTGREAEALLSGAFTFVEKPVNVDRLVPLIKTAMEKSLLRVRVAEANRQSLSKLGLAGRRIGLKTRPSDPSDPS